MRAALVALALPVALPAQQDPTRLEAELSASLFFGNVSQTLATMRTTFERRDSSHALRTEARFNYGETEDDGGDRAVSRRSWIGSVNLDWRPFAPHSQFVVATVESSLEKRIQLRYSGGVGHKVALLRGERSTVDLSLALLAERTLAAESPSGATNPNDLLARWSTRFRATHDFTERVEFRSETFYRPAFGRFGEFTFTTTTSLGYRAARFLQVRLSFQDNYDSEARVRGARTNNEGEIVVGLMSQF
jgi:hypothetical protein